MANVTGFRCATCGEWHDELPLDLSFDEPLYVHQLAAAERALRVLGGPDKDFRILRNEDGTRHYFVRGVIEIPIVRRNEIFCYGVWSSLSEASFARATKAYKRNEADGPFFGWLSNQLPDYPDTLSLKTNVHVRADCRPRIELEPTDHPLAVEQREGLTMEHMQEIVETAMHPDFKRRPA